MPGKASLVFVDARRARTLPAGIQRAKVSSPFATGALGERGSGARFACGIEGNPRFMTEITLRKGTRVRAVWPEARPTSLAGVQMKFGATSREVTGVVEHLRGDHPTSPSPDSIRLLVRPDGGGPLGDVRPRHVVEVLAPGPR